MIARVPTIFTSIDGTASLSGFLTEPDRYRTLLDSRRDGPQIARGGGLSYVAASMGADVTSVGMRYFDRILAFDAENGIINVEAGARLGTILQFLLPRGLILPVIPGHPAITVGGCIACDVHGKNPVRDQTFRNHVISLELWHHRLGLRRIEAGTPAFEATCGGYGLTGIIVSAQLQARPVKGEVARLALTPVSDFDQTQAMLRAKSEKADLLYSWHDWTRPGLARGFIVEGTVISDTRQKCVNAAPLPTLSGKKGYPLMNRLTIPLFNAAYGRKLSQGQGRLTPLTDLLFPLSSFGFYYRLYGSGLLEHQVLVPHGMWSRYWPALGRLFQDHGVRPVVTSLRMFRGARRGIAFSGEGISLTFDLVNNARAQALLAKLDVIDCDMGAVANPAKDSRLTAAVFRRQTPDLDSFLGERTALDPDGSFRSALSARLSL